MTTESEINNYIPLYYLQKQFVDKDTGLPLSNGTVAFFKNNDRTTLTGYKPVYVLVGTPGFYTFQALPNPITLSSIGTIVYNNSNAVVYCYPYDDAGDIEQYYITVRNYLGALQFTEQAVPANIESSSAPDSLGNINYNFNGQFDFFNSEIKLNQLYNLSNIMNDSPSGAYKIFDINGSLLTPDVKYGTLFYRKNITATDCLDTIAINEFNIVPIPGASITTAKNYFYFNRSTLAPGQTINEIAQILGDVNSFSSKNIYISVKASSGSITEEFNIKVFCLQDKNGRDTPVKTYSSDIATINRTLGEYHFSLSVPSVVIDSIESYNYFAIGIEFPLDILFDINITDWQPNNISLTAPYYYQVKADLYPKYIANKINNIPALNAVNTYGPTVVDTRPIPYGINGINGMSLYIENYNYTTSLTSDLRWQQSPPIGMSMKWDWPLSMLPHGWKNKDGRTISAYKYNELYRLATANYSAMPIYGYGSSTEATIQPDPSTVLVLNKLAGVCPNPIISCSSITLNVLQIGDALNQLMYKLTVTDISIKSGDHIQVYVPADGEWTVKEYVLSFIVDGAINTNIDYEEYFNDTTIFVYINSFMTTSEIAKVLELALNPLCFKLPDSRGLSERMVNGAKTGNYSDPDAATRANRGDGTTGNAVGTLQLDELKSHRHNINVIAQGLNGGPNFPGYKDSTTSGLSTLDTGGNETRGKNRYVYDVIKV